MTGVSVLVSVLGTITHSMCVCHLAIKLYCIVCYLQVQDHSEGSYNQI